MNCEQKTLKEFIDVLASDSPTPGGGGASALAGALGTALGNMVGSLTLGKKKYAHVEIDILKLKAKAEILQGRLLELIDEDAKAFAPLARAYKLPKDTEDQRKEKEKIMEVCLVDAAMVPLEIMKTCSQAIELEKEFSEKGSKMAVSDAGVGVVLCKAALQGASLNVFVNTGLMKNLEKAQEIENAANDILDKYTKMADEIFEQVRAKL